MTQKRRFPKPEHDLATLFPKITSEWDYEKNWPFTPDQFSPKSSKKAFWICGKRGHSWSANIYSRTGGQNCPYCSGRRPILGETDMATLYPNTAEEWNYKRNGHMMPHQFTGRSGEKVWWVCSKGHEWQATIHHRTRGSKCPYCTHQKPIPGETDLLTTHPHIAIEWDYEKNAPLKPEHVMGKSTKRVWWLCKRNHSWQASIDNRTRISKCPYCIGRIPILGETDLRTQYPEISAEWNVMKNINLKPEQFTRGSRRKVWWICKEGHEWQAKISARTLIGTNCPYCAGKIPILGETDLATLFPKIAEEWDYEKNNITPKQVTANSCKKVYWKCSVCNHNWNAVIGNRTRGSGCPRYQYHSKA